MNEHIGLEAKIDRLSADVSEMLERQRGLSRAIEEFNPILREVMAVGETKLQVLEERGYFVFLRQAMRTFDKVVAGYTEEDLERFGDSVVNILDTVRNLTQPDVLELANDAAEAVHDAGDAEPVGAWGMYKASKDADVRKGMAVMFEVLRQIGKGAQRMGNAPKPDRRVAPARKALAAPRPAAAAAAEKADRPAVSCPQPEPAADRPAPGEGYGPGKLFDVDGFLLDPQTWTPEIAASLAEAIGFELTEAHWPVIHWARAEWLETKASPNVRRITQGSGVDTRTIYQLFPKSPGKSVARFAGIPKPGGCI